MIPPTKTWVAAYLYYAEPWEEFLTQAVKPFVETTLKKGVAKQFFFIRYWERGPHIRLRFRGERCVLEQILKPELSSFFCGYFKEKPSVRKDPELPQQLLEDQGWFPNHSIQYVQYEPEVERYGGPTGMAIAERQFQISSQTVLAAIEESDGWDYDRALGAAIQLHIGFAFALGMSLPEICQFYRFVSNSWIGRNYDSANTPAEEPQKQHALILKTFEDGFNKQGPTLIPYFQTLWNAFEDKVEFEQAWLNNWLNQMTVVGAELREAQRAYGLIFPLSSRLGRQKDVVETSQQLWPILESYVHMTNNRLGIFNRDESYLGYLIYRGVEQLGVVH